MALENSIPSSIRISGSKEDFERQLFERAYLREGFEEYEDVVQVPVFISKLNNNAQTFIAKVREDFRLNPNNMLMHSGFHILKKIPENIDRIPSGIVSEDGEVDLFLAGQLEELKHLKPSKKTVLFSALKKIVQTKDQIPILSELNAHQVFAYLFLENEKFLKVFQYADYENTPPKCVVIDSGQSDLNACAVLRLLFMHILAFDIVIASYKSHASIEKHFPEHFYDVYEYDEGRSNYEVTKDKKPILPIALWSLFALIIVYVVLHWGLRII